MKKIIPFLTTSILFMSSAPKLHSTIKVEQKTKDKSRVITFTVVPNSDTGLTTDAPWKLVIDSKDGTWPKKVFVQEDFNEKIPGFTATVASPSDVKGTYELTAFVCTKDKSQCFRDVHKGSFP